MPGKNPYSFWALNKKALFFIWCASAFMFSCLVAVVSVSIYLGDSPNKPTTENLLYCFLGAVVGAPFFILFGGTIEWLLKDYFRRKNYSKHPFNQMSELGFKDLVVGNRWTLLWCIKHGMIKGFPVAADCSIKDKPFLAFYFQTEPHNLKNKEFKKMEKELKVIGIHLVYLEGAYIQFNNREPKVSTIEELEKELVRVAEALEAHGLRPYQTTDPDQDKLN